MKPRAKINGTEEHLRKLVKQLVSFKYLQNWQVWDNFMEQVT